MFFKNQGHNAFQSFDSKFKDSPWRSRTSEVGYLFSLKSAVAVVLTAYLYVFLLKLKCGRLYKGTSD